MDRFLVSILLLLCVSPPTPLGDGAKREEPASLELHDPDHADVCDDGKYRVEDDLGDEGNWKCQQKSHFVITSYYATGHSECSNSTSEPEYKCMSEALHYDIQPPSSGAFRPKPPKYGDYHYLPPQRWLNALNHGAVAFLYHPCARQEDVVALKHLATSCLWKHVITPYPHLTTDQPLAVVTWGCVYRMSWVDTSKAKLWIRQHALQTENSVIVTNGDYDRGLLEHAQIVSTQEDAVVCPDKDRGHPADNPESTVTATDPTTASLTTHGETSDSTTPTESESHSSITEPASLAPDNENTSSGSAPTTSSTLATATETKLCRNRTAVSSDGINCSPTVVTVLLSNHPGYIALILVASLALVAVVMAFVWKSGICRSGNRRRAKYKSVSKFFPFSYSQGEGSQVAMPELGLPKALPAEREMLLNDSDEDEL